LFTEKRRFEMKLTWNYFSAQPASQNHRKVAALLNGSMRKSHLGTGGRDQ
jgi:hypothetical protein